MEAIMQWGSITLLSVIAFLVGWKILGLLGAIALAVVVCLATGILTIAI
ncbi:MAG: hypothetical protein JXB14_06575 [Candidatus Altiarchaeota archaeon]|nr:hypothetical protein [Candidatus Altiarchaeota archaeon]